MNSKSLLSAFVLLPFTLFAQVEGVIPNTLRSSWPWDLTYLEVDAEIADTLATATASGHTRPVQIERVQRDGREIARAWFVATIDEEESYEDSRGRNVTGILDRVPVTFGTEEIPPGISMRDQDTYHLIDNGMYEFRLRKGQQFTDPRPFSEVPHWFAGGRVKGTEAWDGRAWFEGDALVRGVEVEILQQGPVFIDVAVRYDFVAEEDGLTSALPLQLGKQVHDWEPNQPPREEIPKLSHAYEVHLRFVMGDPWIEANERFHLPASDAAGPFGIHQHWMAWGDPTNAPDLPGFSPDEHMPVDTVTWVRWFLYDQFGGNTTQHWVPAEPRPDQTGRPFALLRPRWNQGGGGSQDFILTSGGENPPGIDHTLNRSWRNPLRDLDRAANDDEEAAAKRDRVGNLRLITDNNKIPLNERYKALYEIADLLEVELTRAADNYSPDNPAVGIIAAFASKWVGPYPATIAAYAQDCNRGSARFPLRDGERSGLHYGQRAFALCIGPRREFNHLNSLVRRHTDWTLVAVTNKYILDWERDPDLAGPNAMISRKRLEQLREAYSSGEGAEAEIFAEELAELRELEAKREELRPRVQELNQIRRDNGRDEAERAAAEEAHDELNRELREVEQQLGSTDMEILRMITSDYSKNINPQDAGLWLERRYQDDFLNPTQRATRNVANFAEADLFAGGRPVGGPLHAAMGYIVTDLDAWPGWHQGWSPGNPNFHTDKYMGAIYIGSAMRDHPHSDEWLGFGYENFMEDIDKVLLAPDGVGYECPGYSGYSLKHQLELARIFLNTGFGNPVTANPLFKETGRWHRKLITPFNHRINLRHAAPIGDTHRWTSGLGHGFGSLASFYAEKDPEFASEMQGAWQLLLDSGMRLRNRLRTQLIDADATIPPMDPMDMDWDSETFYGFGAILRNNFGSERESFLTVKAGPTRGHYHNDELAYHFYSHGEPISLDYNCSYTPRGDHAALHNSMTFGREGTVRHNQRNANVQGMEQIFSTANAGGFGSSEFADVFVAERRSNSVNMTPLYPEDHEFGRSYEGREVSPIVHRRLISMVKHEEGSPFADYLVVRDETQSEEAQAVNIHLLSRELSVDGNLITATGQHKMDMALYVAEATDLKIDQRHWSYSDSWMMSPGEQYTFRVGETMDEWAARMEALKREHGVDSIPLPGWKPAWRPGRQEPEAWQAWRKLIEESDGKALIPPPGWTETWMYGEYQQWVRLETAPGTPVLWVLYPYERGTPQPTFETLANGTGVRVTLNGVSDEIFLATNPAEGIPGQAVIRRNGVERILLETEEVAPLGEIPNIPLAK
ncbi:MAG: hypothetical protein JJU29_03765 [Verrucomicrobia bacterium]|nr:hypothetical protein [Verrucomicrobiota bacterium]